MVHRVGKLFLKRRLGKLKILSDIKALRAVGLTSAALDAIGGLSVILHNIVKRRDLKRL